MKRVLVVLAFMVGCGGTPRSPASDSTVSVVLKPDSLQLFEGQIVQLTATVKGSPARVRWSSSHPRIASVDSLGVVTAHDSGLTTITASVP